MIKLSSADNILTSVSKSKPDVDDVVTFSSFNDVELSST